MTIHHHIEGLAGLILAVQDLAQEIRVMNTRATCSVKVISEADQDNAPKERKRYKGVYTDEQSISSKVGRKVSRGELKQAADAVGVHYIQDETNHHVYVKNTVLDIVLKKLKEREEE